MKMKMMEVHWRDSMSLNGWQNQETIDGWLKENGYDTMVSIGYVYASPGDMDCICLIQSFHGDDDDSALAQPLSIPVTSIISTRELT